MQSLEIMKKTSQAATADEYIVVCISRQIKNHEVVAQGIATPLVAAGYLLARKTHAPDLYFTSAIGQGICRDPAPLSIANIEKLWLDRSLTNAGFVTAAADVLPRLKPKEFFRPGQVDAFGNSNNIAIGKDYITLGRKHLRLRLPGSGGIPDVTTFISDICMYVPRHSRVTFVERIDVCSGLGYHPARKYGHGPVYLVTDLGQFDFSNGKMRLISVHPGNTIEYIRMKTGFELEVATDCGETPLPTPKELKLLRTEIDPLGIRRLELLSGAPRKQLLHEILRQEGGLL
jgi:acyl CoA:acetate/3-ketoacid CoA transferase beta subunit